MGTYGLRPPALGPAALMMSVALLAGCGQVAAGSSPAGGTSVPYTQPSAAARQARGHPAPTHPLPSLPPVGPYRPPTRGAGTTGATVPAADLTAFAPGVRHLFEDYQAGKLTPYDFTKLTLTKLGYRPGPLPARYADAPSKLTQGDLIALAMASRDAGRRLSAEQVAALKAEATAQP